MKFTGSKGEIKLITLDPGHFHAALVQKTMYEQISPIVYLYAPKGSDVEDHLKLIEGFNTRKDNPTNWKEEVYIGDDYLEKLLQEKPGNVVMLAGNNKKKTDYILSSAKAGLNVLSDKPMCIDSKGFEKLKQAFDTAEKNGIFIYDIMTERFSVLNNIQNELSNNRKIFGELEKGTIDNPAVTKESVHHFFKYVSGNPLKRPGWYFDTTQQGEGLVDVTTHFADMIMWQCFPGEIIKYSDIKIQKAKRWPTMISKEQYEKVTGLKEFLDYLKNKLGEDGDLPCYANGEMVYTIKNVYAKISVQWNFEAPQDCKDTHYSVMRGTKANLIVRQNKEQNYKQQLYVEPTEGTDKKELETALQKAVEEMQADYPGVSTEEINNGWQIIIPDKLEPGHEAHFGKVVQNYLGYIAKGKMPDWEIPNMKTKYYTTTQALKIANK